MTPYPANLQSLISHFSRFPGIGEKTARRFVFYLLRLPGDERKKFASLIERLSDDITLCERCYNYSEKTPCTLCSSPERDQSLLCVVAASHNIAAIEHTHEFHGIYHILGGTMNILEGITPDKLKIKELVMRIMHAHAAPKEVILAFNPDLEGETTMLYLSKILKKYPVRVTRLARGLPRGADIEYADEVTLSDALKLRKELNTEEREP